MSSMELKSALSKLATAVRTRKGQRVGWGREGEKLDLTPGCTFGVVVEQRLKDIDRELAEVKGRLNGLIFLVAGAVVVDVVIRLAR